MINASWAASSASSGVAHRERAIRRTWGCDPATSSVIEARSPSRADFTRASVGHGCSLTGTRLGSQRAERWGAVHRNGDDDSVDGHGDLLVRRLAAGRTPRGRLHLAPRPATSQKSRRSRTLRRSCALLWSRTWPEGKEAL